MKHIFIDGSAGTTGLRLKKRLESRKDINLIEINEQHRKDEKYRQEAMNKADAVVLCLPDDASREAVKLVQNENTVILDTSTAHRTNPEWVYGLPQLSKEQKLKIANSKKIAVPGCHACGFITLVAPLVKEKIILPNILLNCFSITGYSGGGKNMISQYQNSDDNLLSAPRVYGLSQEHKHLSEMISMTNLDNYPVFAPIVSNFYSGMEVMIPISPEGINYYVNIDKIKNIYKKYYNDDVIKFVDNPSENGFMSASAFSGKDSMQITVQGNEERFLLIARYDNLGKGASGSAVECLNLSLGLEHKLGLEL